MCQVWLGECSGSYLKYGVPGGFISSCLEKLREPERVQEVGRDSREREQVQAPGLVWQQEPEKVRVPGSRL